MFARMMSRSIAQMFIGFSRAMSMPRDEPQNFRPLRTFYRNFSALF